MKLLVDIGNSRVKWATLDKSGLNDSHSFQRAKTGIKASLNKAWKNLSDIEAVYVANVGGDKLAQQLTEWTQKTWQITPNFIISEKKRFGVTNAYDEPEKLGIDRWLSLIAARQHARQAQCVIDCGTAMTIDIVSKTGQHQGGMILPGLSLMRSSLAANTDALTEAPGEKEFNTLATNTFSAIQAGTLYSVSATLERIINDLKQTFNNQVRFSITGGDAEQLLPLLPDDINHYPDIVLKGLAFYVRQDDKKKSRVKKSEVSTESTITDDDKPEEKSAQTAENHPQADSKNETATNKKPRRSRGKKVQTQADKPASGKDKPGSALPEEAI
ncbi:type III pantothenate kinase [Methylophaga sp.]|uniref:type III pantothenate kinase n=1 Tax=Methylophaga sp. TaxID=2024840 RepID=UPI0014005C55|nr:type III pantothenate kinase [Methylophaga sp.]MTI62635.1 type III pantothenate kinase [Methylophaga sp.]